VAPSSMPGWVSAENDARPTSTLQTGGKTTVKLLHPPAGTTNQPAGQHRPTTRPWCSKTADDPHYAEFMSAAGSSAVTGGVNTPTLPAANTLYTGGNAVIGRHAARRHRPALQGNIANMPTVAFQPDRAGTYAGDVREAAPRCSEQVERHGFDPDGRQRYNRPATTVSAGTLPGQQHQPCRATSSTTTPILSVSSQQRHRTYSGVNHPAAGSP